MNLISRVAFTKSFPLWGGAFWEPFVTNTKNTYSKCLFTLKGVLKIAKYHDKLAKKLDIWLIVVLYEVGLLSAFILNT